MEKCFIKISIEDLKIIIDFMMTIPKDLAKLFKKQKNSHLKIRQHSSDLKGGKSGEFEKVANLSRSLLMRGHRSVGEGQDRSADKSAITEGEINKMKFDFEPFEVLIMN